MALFNPIQYTSRTFESILQDINNDPELIDRPNWWKRCIAGIGDVISMWNNALANNLLLDTAYTRRNVQLLLQLIDYLMTPQSTASGILLFYLDGSVTFPLSVSKADLVGLTAGTTSVSSKRFESRMNVTINQITDIVPFTAVNTTTDIITVARDFITGEKVRLTSSGGLPSPLLVATDYYVIRISATEIQLASSLNDALAGTYIVLTTQGTGNHTIILYSAQIDCYQQQTKDSYIAGSSDGITPWQEFNLGDVDILQDTIEVSINSIIWSRVDTWIDSTSTDKHYRVFYNNDNTVKIQFGNGVYGLIPPAFDIETDYAIGGGSDSNVNVVNKINVYGGTDSNITGVMNPEVITGGADEQTINDAKILGPILLKSRDRFVTTEDGEALALAYGGISQVHIIRNAFGVLSARVLCISNGGGLLDAPTKTALEDYLIDRTVLESIDVRVEDPTITPINTTSAGKVLVGYVWTGQVEENFRLGWKLFWTEAGKELLSDYNSNGVDSARDLINTIFSESYTSSDNPQIQEFLDNYIPREINEPDIQISDAFGFLDAHTIGLDNMTITLPAFPVAIAEDEITTYGTLILTEIP